MNTSSFPTDLFDKEHREKKERKLSYFVNKYAKQRFLPYLRVPVEYTIIAGILIIVLMILSYAVGIEKGKRQGTVFEGQETAQDLPMMIAQAPDTQTGIAKTDDLSMPADVNESVEPDAGEPPVKDEETAFVPGGSVYVVQLASFKKEKYAEEEVSKLETGGEHAGYLKAGDWYQVYAEGYDTIDEARDAQRAFNDKYPGCYVRRRK
jgi:hypothetical protein